jgi:hypothetical protein
LSTAKETVSMRSAAHRKKTGEDPMQFLKIITFAVLLGFLTNAAEAGPRSSLRCGGDIVDLGDRTFMVQQKCGDPVYVNIIDFVDEIIEEWVYGPVSGYYYFVRFEGGQVKEIESERK